MTFILMWKAMHIRYDREFVEKQSDHICVELLLKKKTITYEISVQQRISSNKRH